MEPFELSGTGVLLATPTVDDVDEITRICQDPDVQRWTTVPVPYRRHHAEEFVGMAAQRWTHGQELTWAVRDPDTRAVLRMVGVNVTSPGSAEVGYWLGPAARRRGLMTTAVRLVTEYAFAPEGLGMHRLVWKAAVGNWASRRLAWRLGFRIEGTVRSELVQRGERRDAWVATLLPGDPTGPSQPWFEVQTLRGDRVVLRRWRMSDADAAVEGCTDPVTRHWLGHLPHPYTRQVALEHIASRETEHASGRGVHWAAALDDEGDAVGSLSLMHIDESEPGGPDSAEIGYWMHPAARGQGVATAAVRLVVVHALAPVTDGGLGLRRLTLAHAAGNEASRAVAPRAGFRPFGVGRSAVHLGDGSYADLHWYDLMASDPR
ncbi:MAG: GNAT family N-acetyltransferase [Jiangellaceae bacterium]